MTNNKYEVAFYLVKKMTGLSAFDTFKEAADHVIACLGRYMVSDSFLSNTESSYCVTVFDFGSDRMIQLLGPLDDSAKAYINAAFDSRRLAIRNS